ncbi:GntR family transcriptional regulator [Actinomadura opuntiae]|uniref:GntR family transcriptional regulator n=1 Tax=Actinomadura sp. OS1-43 TaxID=604315 RepID=UPI00255B1EAC|nr:GntR family transcriptional regulator [Actinomadura sp. OS1-43]MDL4818581.1 GntR family transcriptional regulator [Actinomadura sp. OS1-43]
MTDSPVPPVEPRSVSELVTIELRRAIVSGELAPGETFSQRKIASDLNVSFIPVREALRALEHEGLVIIRPGRGACVAPLYLEDLQGIYRLRRNLEPDLAAHSCTLISDAELDRLQAQVEDFGDERHTIQTVYDSHHEFHVALIAPAATVWDMRVLNSLWRAAERYIRIGFSKLDPDPQDKPRRRHAHESLLDAFRRRDPAAVADAVLVHLTSNEQTALRALADGQYLATRSES